MQWLGCESSDALGSLLPQTGVDNGAHNAERLLMVEEREEVEMRYDGGISAGGSLGSDFVTAQRLCYSCQVLAFAFPAEVMQSHYYLYEAKVEERPPRPRGPSEPRCPTTERPEPENQTSVSPSFAPLRHFAFLLTCQKCGNNRGASPWNNDSVWSQMIT